MSSPLRVSNYEIRFVRRYLSAVTMKKHDSNHCMINATIGCPYNFVLYAELAWICDELRVVHGCAKISEKPTYDILPKKICVCNALRG